MVGGDDTSHYGHAYFRTSDADRSMSYQARMCVDTSHNTTSALTYSIQGLSRSEEHTSELQSRLHLVCRLLLEKKKKNTQKKKTKNNKQKTKNKKKKEALHDAHE